MSPSQQQQEIENTKAILATLATPGGFMLSALISPDSFPQVTVGGASYEMRLSLRSKIYLEKQYKIPNQDMAAWMGQHHQSHCYAAMMAVLTGAMLGRIVAGKWVAMPMTDEQLMDTITEAEWEQIQNQYAEALGKVMAGMQKALESLPKKNPEPTPETTAEVVN